MMIAADQQNKKPAKRVMLLQLNEALMPLIKGYASSASLPNWQRLFRENELVEFTSETEDKYLEPWIQWVSFYTRKPFKKHQIFHLNDYQKPDADDLFVSLKAKGKKIGLFCAMSHPGLAGLDVYIPDPWSKNTSDPSITSRAMDKLCKYFVLQNTRVPNPFPVLISFLILFFSIKGLKKYSVILRSFQALLSKDRVRLSAFFDLFLLMFAASQHQNKQLDFSAIFINGLAHIQHHYLLSSSRLEGQNPDWYVAPDTDPILKALHIYDEGLAWLYSQNLDFVTVTGLSQKTLEQPVFYWRLRSHQQLLEKIINDDFVCNPKMSRDFDLAFQDEASAERAMAILKACMISDMNGAQSAFGHFDRRGKNLFCSLIYSGNGQAAILQHPAGKIPISKEINFVAIKNSIHDSKGWMLLPRNQKPDHFPANLKCWQLGTYIEKCIP